MKQKGRNAPKNWALTASWSSGGGDPLERERIAALPYVTGLAAIRATDERQEGWRLSSDTSDISDTSTCLVHVMDEV